MTSNANWRTYAFAPPRARIPHARLTTAPHVALDPAHIEPTAIGAPAAKDTGKQLTAEAVAAHFKRKPLAGVTDVLNTLEAMGLVNREGTVFRA